MTILLYTHVDCEQKGGIGGESVRDWEGNGGDVREWEGNGGEEVKM